MNEGRRWTIFGELSSVEPGLGRLLREARAVKPGRRSFCANATWNRRFRDGLDDLAGFYARRKVLRSREAHDLARRTIYGALPDCRNCSCVGLDELLVARLGARHPLVLKRRSRLRAAARRAAHERVR